MLRPSLSSHLAARAAANLEARAAAIRAEAPIKCPECDTENTSDSSFCKGCGAKLAKPAADEQPKKKPGAPEERAAGFGPSSPSARNAALDRATCQRIAARTGRAVADVEHAARAMGFGPRGGK